MGPLLKDLGVQQLEGVDLSSKMLQVRLHCLGILDLHRRTALSMGFSHQVFRGYLSELFISAIGGFPARFPSKPDFSRGTTHPPQKKYFDSQQLYSLTYLHKSSILQVPTGTRLRMLL